MPIKLNKAYTRATRNMRPDIRTRLDSIIDADPRMAKHLNEYGMVNAATSEHPIAVIPPEKYLQMARKQEHDMTDKDNRKGLLSRIMTRGPTAQQMDFYSPDSTPEFLHGYLKRNKDPSAYNIYSHKGIGLPDGFDMHQGVSVHDDASDFALDLGGLSALKYTPRGDKAISITDHEGRGRNAFAAAKEFSLPTQMIERAAILPDDVYMPTGNVDSILRRLDPARDPDEIDQAANSLWMHNEPALLNETGDPMLLPDARQFLQQITSVIPEEYIRHGVNRRGTQGGKPLGVPWKFPVFAEGGTVQPYDSSKDDTGMLRKLGDFMRMAQMGPHLMPGTELVAKSLPRVAEGLASEYYGVNQEGRVNAGGYTKGAPMRDRFRPNVAIETLSLPGMFGNKAGQEAQGDIDRTDTAVREAFGNGDPANFGEDAAYLAGKALAVPLVSGGRGLQTLTGGMLKNASKWLRYPAKALETATDLFNPANGRIRDVPAAGIAGAGISEGLNAGMEKYYTHQAAKEDARAKAEEEAVLNDPQFQQALAAGDKQAALRIAHNIVEQFNAR